VAPVALEINTFIDQILDQILRGKSDRKIMLSSFSPEVCMLLTTKQDTYPVMFITNAGKLPASDMDMRASSLQAAVHFAKRWALAGVVFASETLIMCPRLVGYVKRSGLVCGSYGSLNNIPENSKVSLRIQSSRFILISFLNWNFGLIVSFTIGTKSGWSSTSHGRQC
jgi:glycerophosphodiester phosphodiesterase